MCRGVDGGLWAIARRKAPRSPAGLEDRLSGRRIDLFQMSSGAYQSPHLEEDPNVGLFRYAPAVKEVM
jgi:hypothetical protein